MNIKTVLATVGVMLVTTAWTTPKSSRDYVQGGLINMWDAFDNVGVGQHDEGATVWKDLVGSMDLTMVLDGTTRKWTGNSLVVNGCTAYGTGATAAYRTLEVVYKMTDSSGRILFASGCQAGGNRRMVLFDNGNELYSDAVDTCIYAPHVVEDKVKSYTVCYDENNVPATLATDGNVLENPSTQKNPWNFGDSKVMVGDRSVASSGYPWKGEVYCIRLYDRVLTSDEIAANNEVDVTRFVNGEFFQSGVRIAGSPAEIGTVTPAYGRVEPASGEQVVCTAPSDGVNAAGTIRGTCLGWTLEKLDGTRTSGDGTTKDFTYYDETFGGAVLTWNWVLSYAVNVRTVCNGRIVGEEKLWTNNAGEITLTRPAIPDGCEFVGWYGAGVPDDGRTSDPLNLTLTAPGTVYAVFRAAGAANVVRFVDGKAGEDSDASEALDPATAWKTLGYAVGRARAGDMIVLTKGTHALTASVTVDKAVTITGDGENWETVLDGNNSCLVTVSADGVLLQNVTFDRVGGAYANGLSIYLSGNSIVSNVVVTGTLRGDTSGNGRYPILAEKGLITHCWITNNFAYGNCGVGLSGTATMENCYIAGNTKKKTGGNGSGVVEISSDKAAMRNCTIVDNLLADTAGVYVSKDADIRNNLIWNNVNFNTDQPANVYDSVAAPKKWIGNCSLPLFGTAENGNISADPMLQDDRKHFLSDSPCRGKAVPPATATDLDGNPRGDKPSIGAFEYVPPATLQVSFVPSATFVRLPATITFEVTLEGPGADDVTYNWDFNGDGIVDSHDPAPVLNVAGMFRPTLEVTTPNGRPATAVCAESIGIHAEGKTTYYIDPTNGSDENDGLSDAKPWKNLSVALRNAMVADDDEIIIVKGTHILKNEATVVNKSVTIRGVGENWETVLDGNLNDCLIKLQAAGARLQNLTMRRMGGKYAVPYAVDVAADATVSNVVFRDTNGGRALKDIGNGRCVVRASAGLVTHCWFTNNVSQDNAGIYISGDKASARVCNSYFAGNTRLKGQNNQHGIVQLYSTGAQAVNCTVVDNVLQGSMALYCTSGAKAYNNLVWNNIDDETKLLANVYVATPASNGKYLAGNCTSPTNDLLGAGNIADDPQLTEDRMHFKSKSPCNGAAIAEYAPATDLDGNPRGDHPSIGAFEYVDTGALEVTLQKSAAFARLPGGITLSASVDGNYTEPLTYSWDFDGDGVEDSDKAAPSITTPGVFKPALTVTDKDGRPASVAFEEALTVHEEGASIYYVNDETGSDDNTGLSPATPMKTYLAALASDLVADGDVIELMKGVHRPTRAVTVDKAVVIRGAGRPEETVIDGQDTDTRFYVEANGAKICNLTLYRVGGNGGEGMSLSQSGDSVVSNVVICCCNANHVPGDSGNGRIVANLSAGLLTHSVVTNNHAWGCAGVALTDTARMENCLVADNWNFFKNGNYYSYGIVYVRRVTSGTVPTVRNCTIVSNRTYESGALWVQEPNGGSLIQPIVENSIIWDNTDYTTGAVMNWHTSSSKYTSEQMTSNMVANCTWPTNGISGAKNIEKDPLFAAKEPYHLSFGSPCRGAGDNASVTSTTDLDGNPRRYGRKVDMGCYELQGGAGLMLLVR